MRATRSVALLLVVFAAVGVAAREAPYYPPRGSWQSVQPDGVGMSAARLDAAVRYAIDNESRRPRDQALSSALGFAREPYNEILGPTSERGDPTGIVIRNGLVVAQWGDPDRVDMTHSITKTFLSTVTGVAVDRGLIESVHDRVADYVPGDYFTSAHNRRITWDHLLRQTSAWEGTLWDKPDWADRPEGDDPLTWPDRPLPEPGAVYEYNDVRVNALALAALYVWRRPLPAVLREHVMDPIGASRVWRWEGYRNSWVVVDGEKMQSVSGGGHWGGGVFLTAWDQARLGYLTLRRGRWQDRQIFSEAWFEQATTPGDANAGYGYMNYFLNTDCERYPSAPASAFAHLGAGTNMVYVDPDNDLIIVARWIDRDALDGLIGRVLDAIERD